MSREKFGSTLQKTPPAFWLVPQQVGLQRRVRSFWRVPGQITFDAWVLWAVRLSVLLIRVCSALIRSLARDRRRQHRPSCSAADRPSRARAFVLKVLEKVSEAEISSAPIHDVEDRCLIVAYYGFSLPKDDVDSARTLCKQGRRAIRR